VLVTGDVAEGEELGSVSFITKIYCAVQIVAGMPRNPGALFMMGGTASGSRFKLLLAIRVPIFTIPV